MNGHSDLIDLLNDWDRERAEGEAKDLQKYYEPYPLKDEDFYTDDRQSQTNGSRMVGNEETAEAEI